MGQAGVGGAVVDGAELLRQRRRVLRDAAGVAVATGAYGLSFGAVATTAGLSVAQTATLSALMYTGASQFALVGVLGPGGGVLAAVAAATLLGARNAFYGLRLAGVLQVRGVRRLLAAQLVIDESCAMAVGHDEPRLARTAFWATGLSVYVLWNLATLLGALGARALEDPRTLGLDAAAPAAFLALLAPQLVDRGVRVPRLGSALLAVALTPAVPAGVPVLAVAVLTVLVGAAPGRSRSARPEQP
jgi:predicted branched-subunit amino acid permease